MALEKASISSMWDDDPDEDLLATQALLAADKSDGETQAIIRDLISAIEELLAEKSFDEDALGDLEDQLLDFIDS